MAMLVAAFAFTAQAVHAQSIQSGVTFQWDGPQPSGQSSANLESVTVGGTVYDTLSLPTDYEMIQVGPGGDDTNRIRQNGSNIEVSSASPTWDATATAAFSSRNLNFMFESSRPNNNAEICNNIGAIATTSNQIQRLSYGAGVPASTGSILAVTERSANNCYYIRIFGIPVGGGPKQELGGTFVNGGSALFGPQFSAPEPGADYWGSGRVNGNNGTIGIALFLLDPLVQAGAIITDVDFIAATQDHGDGKIFIINSSAPIIANDDISENVDGALGASAVLNVLSNDSLRNLPPTASSATITVVNAASNPGVTLDTSTGNINVAPGVPVGSYSIDYQICETARPSNCDTATVTVPVVGLRVLKDSTVISDPSNGAANPKAIPGAVIRYCIQIVNDAQAATAQSINVLDDLGALPVTFVQGSIRVDGNVSDGRCDFGTGSPGGSFSGSTVSATLSNLPPGETRTLYFDVSMN